MTPDATVSRLDAVLAARRAWATMIRVIGEHRETCNDCQGHDVRCLRYAELDAVERCVWDALERARAVAP